MGHTCVWGCTFRQHLPAPVPAEIKPGSCYSTHKTLRTWSPGYCFKFLANPFPKESEELSSQGPAGLAVPGATSDLARCPRSPRGWWLKALCLFIYLAFNVGTCLPACQGTNLLAQQAGDSGMAQPFPPGQQGMTGGQWNDRGTIECSHGMAGDME